MVVRAFSPVSVIRYIFFFLISRNSLYFIGYFGSGAYLLRFYINLEPWKEKNRSLYEKRIFLNAYEILCPMAVI